METLSNAAALTAIVTFVTSLLKPFIEQVPFAKPTAPLHDSVLRLCNVLLNLGAVLALAAANNQLVASNLLQLVLQALVQAAGAQLLYTSTTRLGGSVNSPSRTAVSSAAVQPDSNPGQ